VADLFLSAAAGDRPVEGEEEEAMTAALFSAASVAALLLSVTAVDWSVEDGVEEEEGRNDGRGESSSVIKNGDEHVAASS